VQNGFRCAILDVSSGWQLIFRIWWTIKIWVLPPGRSFADKAGGKGILSDNSNAAAPSGWKSDQDALTISAGSEMYHTAVICLCWACDSFCIARMFLLPCHISKTSWTLPILCNFLSSASFFISKSLSFFMVSNSGSVPAKILWLGWANCLATTFSQWVSPVDFNCLQAITSRPREKLGSTLTWCGMKENMTRATLERSAYCQFVSSCCRHQLGMTSI